ncbi:MAG: hypothetical protein MK538_14120 [Planctomycetes bacterium]|nr:hypothetical protein [Planctomycetota bacterium]
MIATSRPNPRQRAEGLGSLATRLSIMPALVGFASTAVVVGCAVDSEVRPSSSVLERTVAAMDRREWERAEGLLADILPTLPETLSGDANAPSVIGSSHE